MMKKMNKYLLSLGVCAGLLAGVAIAKPFDKEQELTKVYGATVSGVETIETRYTYNTFFTIPDAKLSYGGKEYSASAKDAVLKFPNGNLVTENGLYLNETGEYTLIYQAKADNVLVSGEKKFTVNKGLYTLSNPQSSITYQEQLRCNEKTDGMTVELAKGDALYFNEAIDLRQTDGSFDFIKFYPYSFTKTGGQDGKQQECAKVTVRLTDCYNEDIYVEYAVAYVGGHAYYRVRSNTQKYSGLNRNDTTAPVYLPRKVVYLDDLRYRAHFDDDFGTTRNVDTLDNVGLSFSMNPYTYRCYAQDTSTLLISDLMNADIYSAYNLFGGFTTGEVYLSLFAEDYVSDYVHFDIENIAGYTGEALKDRVYSDTVAPEITLLGANDEQNFTIALNQKFTLFEANVTDVNLVGGVHTYVYYKYGTEAQEQVLVKDGAFTPKKEGEYTVVYSAKDTFGNVGRALLGLYCVKTENGKNIRFDVELPETLPAGETAVLPAHEAVGINGEVAVTCKAVSVADGKETIISSSSREFQPLSIGKYKIVYTCTDKLGSEEFSYEITSVASDCMIADKELILPKYFIKGLRYSVDELKVTLFSGTQTEYKSGDFEISQDDKAFEKISFDDFAITASETVSFRLVYDGKTVLETNKYKVVDTGYSTNAFSHTKYFYSDVDNIGVEAFSVTATSQYVLCKANETTGNSKMDYVSPLIIDAFNFDFSPVAEKSNFGAFAISFTDYYNRQNVHTLNFRNAGSVTYVSLDNGVETRMEKRFDSKHTVEYDVKTASLIVNKAINGGAKYPVGALFTDHKILFGFECKQMNGECEVALYRLFKQTLSNTKVDNSLPQITAQMPSSLAKKDSVITIDSAVVADMFSPVLKSNVTVTVLGPDKQPVTSEEGVVLDGTSLANTAYTVKCADYGLYSIVYNAVDQSGRKGNLPFNVNVEDDEAPTIKLLDGYQKGCIFTVGKGATVKVAGYEVQDNFGADKVTTYVMVYDCYGAFVHLSKDNSFVANRVGTWQVVYTAYDEIGNYVSVRYTVEVK